MKVSVCIPTANPARVRWLREAVASVAAQTHCGVAIVIGDNSQDSALRSSIDSIAAEHPALGLRVVTHPSRVSVAENFNAMIDAAAGEGVLFLMDDDLLCPGFVERAVGALQRHPQCGFVFGDLWVINEDGVVDREKSAGIAAQYGRDRLREGIYPPSALFRLALDQSFCLQAMFFRREILAPYRFTPGMICIDLWIQLQLAADHRQLHAYYLDERVFKYRIHGEQMTSSVGGSAWLKSAISAYEACDRVPREYQREVRATVADKYVSLALIEAEMREEGAAHHALHGFRLAPALRRAIPATLVVAFPWAIAPIRRIRKMVQGRDRSVHP